MIRQLMLFLATLACLAIPLACNLGNGSGVGNGMITGKLYEPDGSTPAQGATVAIRLQSSTGSPNAGVAKKTVARYSTLTRHDGSFSFDTIADGLYAVEGSDDNRNMVFFDSVRVAAADDPVQLPADTLKPAGTITGTVTLTIGGSYDNVYVTAYGIDRYCLVDENGAFTFKGLAEGTYTLQVGSSGDIYGTADVEHVSVRSDSSTSVNTVPLPGKSPLPVPQSLRVVYDSLLMMATLSWDPTPPGTAKAYRVYRTIPTFAPDTVPDSEVLDAMLRSTTTTDSSIFAKTVYTPYVREGTYSVSMIDSSGIESSRSEPVTVRYSNAWDLYDSIVLDTVIGQPSDFRFDSAGNLLLLDFSLTDATMHFYRFSPAGTTIESWPVTGSQGMGIVGSDGQGSLWTSSGGIMYHYSNSGTAMDSAELLSNASDRMTAFEPNLWPTLDGRSYYLTNENKICSFKFSDATIQKVFDVNGTVFGISALNDGTLIITTILNATFAVTSYSLTGAVGPELLTQPCPARMTEFCKVVKTAGGDLLVTFKYFCHRLGQDHRLLSCNTPTLCEKPYVSDDGSFIRFEGASVYHPKPVLYFFRLKDDL